MIKNMTFYSHNNATSTSIIVSSGTSTSSNLYDNDSSTSWTADTTTAIISFDLDNYSPSDGKTTITAITLRGINWKSFSISNGVTTSSNIIIGPTTSANFTNNSMTSIFLEMDETNFNGSWTITVNSTNDDGNVSCSELSFLAELCEIDNNPSSENYTPVISRKSVEHEMQDGGIIIYEFGRQFRSELLIENISEENRDELLSVFEYIGEFNFIPFPSSNWDNKQYKCFWINDFQFYVPSDIIFENGFGGSIELEEST